MDVLVSEQVRWQRAPGTGCGACQDDLDEPIEHFGLLEGVLRLGALLDALREVAALAVGHDHAQ